MNRAPGLSSNLNKNRTRFQVFQRNFRKCFRRAILPNIWNGNFSSSAIQYIAKKINKKKERRKENKKEKKCILKGRVAVLFWLILSYDAYHYWFSYPFFWPLIFFHVEISFWEIFLFWTYFTIYSKNQNFDLRISHKTYESNQVSI